MENDKISKIIESINNFVIRILVLMSNYLNMFVRKVDALDPKANTKQRIITSLVLIPLALYAIYFSKNLFLFIAIAITILMTIEWLDMIKNSHEITKWRLVGFFYILIPIYAVIRLRFIDEDIVFWMFAIIWATDIFAFFAGRTLGGPKLAPTISPNKTWSGMAGGVLASAIIGFISAFMFTGSVMFFVFASIFLSLIEQISDLLESKFKRIFGVKDSGNIIPGHGGILDRLDGMMLVAPIALVLVTIFRRNFGL